MKLIANPTLRIAAIEVSLEVVLPYESILDSNDDGYKYYQQNNRENEETKRQGQLDRQRIGLGLSANQSLLTHFVAENPQRTANARPKLLGLFQQHNEAQDLLYVEASVQAFECCGRSAAGPQLQIEKVQIGPKLWGRLDNFLTDTIQSTGQAVPGLNAHDQ